MLDGWTTMACWQGYTPCSTIGSSALTTTKPNDLIVLIVYACAPVPVPMQQAVPPSCLSSGSPLTVSDSASLTWTQRPSSGIGYEYYATPSSPITSDVITVSSNSLNNCSSPCAITMQIAAFSGTKQIFDPNVAFTETGCPQPQSQPCTTSISTTNTYDVLIGSTVFAGNNGGGAASPTACCTYISSEFGYGYGTLTQMYELTSSAGSNSMSFNWSGCTSSQYCNPTAFDIDAIEARTSLSPTFGAVFDVNPNDKVFDSDFRLLPPDSGLWLSMTAGSTLSFPISLEAFPDFSGLVSVSGPNIQGPPGWQVCNPTCSASMNGNMSIPNASNVMLAPNQNKTITVTLTTTANAPLGNYTIGFGSVASFGPNHPLNVVVSVVDFRLSAPSSLGVSSGLSTNTQITTIDLASGPINVTLSGSVPALYQPTGSAQARPLSISFGQTSVFLTSGQTSDQMTMSALNVPAGVTYYPVNITGTVKTTSGTTISHSIIMNVTVSGFSMTADGVSCTVPTYILCLSVPQNGVPGDTVYLYASGTTGTVTYSVSISPCVSLCNGGTPPSVFWNDTRSSQTSIGVTSSSCYQRSIYGTQSVGNYCGQRLLIIHAYDGLGNYNITVTGTCTGSCLNSQYTFYIWFNVFQSGGGGGGSVAAGTLITLPDGSQVPVQNLGEGMQVLSFDMSTHNYVTTTITRYLSVVTNNQMEIYTSLIVDQNPAQKLYVQTPDGTVRLMSVTQLQVGYKLFNALSEQWVPITALHYQNGGRHVMYDIYTTTPGNYIANGILDPLKT